MKIWQIILTIVVALSGFPAGRFIASKTPEELKAGKKWFKLIILMCIFGVIVSVITLTDDLLILAISSLVFIFLIAFASLKK